MVIKHLIDPTDDTRGTDTPPGDQTVQLQCPRCRRWVPFLVTKRSRVDVEWVDTTTWGGGPSALAHLNARIEATSGHSC